MAETIRPDSRTRQSVLLDLKADQDYLRAPDWIPRGLAELAGHSSDMTNLAASQLFIWTTQARPTAQYVFALIDHDLKWKTPASAEITVAISAPGPYTIPADELIFETARISGQAAIRYEARASLFFDTGETEKTITAYAQETQPAQDLGLTDGSDFQELEIPDLDAIRETMRLDIGGSEYVRVNTFVNSSPTDQHFLLLHRSDGSSYIVLPGENEFDQTIWGKIPSGGQTVTAFYAIGGGLIGNTAASTITQYIGGNIQVASVNNPDPVIDGAEEETLDRARRTAPLAIRAAGEIFTNESTGEGLVLDNFPEVLDVQIVKYPVGVFRAVVYLLPVGGGVPAPSLKDQVETLLVQASDMEQAIIDTPDPTYLDADLEARVSMKEGQVFSRQVRYVELALALRASPIARNIHSIFDERGLGPAIDQINNDFATLIPYLIGANLYNVTDDGVAIGYLLGSEGDTLNTPFQSFGEDLYPSDLSSPILSWIFSVDECVIDSPSSVLQPGDGGLVNPVSITVAELL
jgi:hypothetical protein